MLAVDEGFFMASESPNTTKNLILLRKFLINLCEMTILCIILNIAWANRWSGERTNNRLIIQRIITTDSYKTPP